jgi:UDP-glucose 4-epimerase
MCIFGAKPPKMHMPLGIVKATAKVRGYLAARKGKIPDLEYDAVRYLYDDYVVDNSRLKETGYRLMYPDFRESMLQIKELYESGQCAIGTESLSSRA